MLMLPSQQISTDVTDSQVNTFKTDVLIATTMQVRYLKGCLCSTEQRPILPVQKTISKQVAFHPIGIIFKQVKAVPCEHVNYKAGFFSGDSTDSVK